MTQLISVEHVSPCCVKLNFDGPLRNDVSLKDVTEYAVPGVSIVSVEVPYAQDQVYDVGPPVIDGGAPYSVYLLCDANPYNVAPIAVGFSGWLPAVVDFDGNPLAVPQTLNLTTFETQDLSYWTDDGLRTKEAFYEFEKLGRAGFGTKQPLNRSTAHMIGKINDLMSGGLIGELSTALPGPAEPEYVQTFSPAGFSACPTPMPGIGDTFSFAGGVIPCHVDKLWGKSDSTHTTFRASIPFHPFSCVVIVAEGDADSIDKGVVESVNWFAPNNGYDRQIRLVNAPPEGATVLAVYVPRQSLLAIGEEIIAYEESDIVAGTAVVYGRAQLSSYISSHEVGSQVRDVWGASFVERAQYNMITFGASGRALEYIGIDYGSPRSDNPSLSDTNLRRMIFHTSVNMRATPGTVWEAIRYIYPELWPFCIVEEDPRWPGCVVIWYSTNTVIGDQSWLTSPHIEPWETWLDHISWPDGYPLELMAETYYRDDAVDPDFYGDFFLEDNTDNPEIWPYPVVISGPSITKLGMPASSIPPPLVSGAAVNTAYRKMLVRPPSLDKVLPAGCGVLLLDFGLL